LTLREKGEDLRLYYNSEEEMVADLLHSFLQISEAPEKTKKLLPYFRQKKTQQLLPLKARIKQYLGLFNEFGIEVFWSQ
jgi:hypothetical protein